MTIEPAKEVCPPMALGKIPSHRIEAVNGVSELPSDLARGFAIHVKSPKSFVTAVIDRPWSEKECRKIPQCFPQKLGRECQHKILHRFDTLPLFFLEGWGIKAAARREIQSA
jgi:hypothetical protein